MLFPRLGSFFSVNIQSEPLRWTFEKPLFRNIDSILKWTDQLHIESFFTDLGKITKLLQDEESSHQPPCRLGGHQPTDFNIFPFQFQRKTSPRVLTLSLDLSLPLFPFSFLSHSHFYALFISLDVIFLLIFISVSLSSLGSPIYSLSLSLSLCFIPLLFHVSLSFFYPPLTLCYSILSFFSIMPSLYLSIHFFIVLFVFLSIFDYFYSSIYLFLRFVSSIIISTLLTPFKRPGKHFDNRIKCRFDDVDDARKRRFSTTFDRHFHWSVGPSIGWKGESIIRSHLLTPKRHSLFHHFFLLFFASSGQE